MQTFRERWLVILGSFSLLTIGNLVANNTRPGEETSTFVYLAIGFIFILVLDFTGWLKCVQSLDCLGCADLLDSSRAENLRTLALFVSLSLYLIGYAAMTRGLHSPLLCVIYLPPILAGLRYGQIPSLLAAISFTIAFFIAYLFYGPQISQYAPAVLTYPVAGLFGAALHSRLHEGFDSMTAKVTELGALMDISQMLETAIDLNTTVNLIVINAKRLVEADVCAVYLCQSNDGSLTLSASSVDEQQCAFCSELTVKDLEAHSWRLCSDDVLTLQRNFDWRSELCDSEWPEGQSLQGIFVSLIGSEGVIGVLYLGRKSLTPPFNQAEKDAIQRYSMHVSQPLQKARYQETLAHLAFRDQMTDLSNFRYFEQRLADDIMRAKRYQQNVTVLLLDIDHFKRFNDHYGHKAGDSLLKQFGFVLKGCLRDSDLPARYGGEEFIVICPGTCDEEIRTVAERIRSAVEHADFKLDQTILGGAETVKITVSLGSASYPRHAGDPANLVRQADRALYSAKNMGRNVYISCDDIAAIDHSVQTRTAA